MQYLPLKKVEHGVILANKLNITHQLKLAKAEEKQVSKRQNNYLSAVILINLFSTFWIILIPLLSFNVNIDSG